MERNSYLPAAGEGEVPQWLGTYPAIVINNDDPLGVGRLQLQVPMVLGPSVSSWAVPSGSYYQIPGNNTVVSCVFLGGDPSQPAWSGPLDISPVVEAAAPPTVTYSASAPPNPRVHDIWYETVNIGGNPFIAAPQIWTFHPLTSTFSWVSQGGVVDQNSLSLANITASVFEGSEFIMNQSGAFFYGGVPGLGNLIASIAAASGTDGFGNVYKSGIISYDTSGTDFIQLLPGATVQLRVGTGDAIESRPGLLNSLAFGSGTSRRLVTNLEAPQVTGQPAGMEALVQLVSCSADLATPPSAFLSVSDGTHPSDFTIGPQTAQLSINGVVVLNVALGATGFTSTSGTVSSPTLITTDSWHAIPLAAGWTAGNPVPSYRLISTGEVRIIGRATHAAFTADTGLSSSALPAAYRPLAEMDIPAAYRGGITSVGGAIVDTSGNVFGSPYNGSTSTTTVIFNGTYPVDLA